MATSATQDPPRPGGHHTYLKKKKKYIYIYIYIYIFHSTYLFLTVLGLHCYAQAFSSCGKQAYSLVAAHALLVLVASLVAQHRP